MRIDHIALWTYDLERMRNFYEKYFQVRSGEKYVNTKKNFESYFLYFDDGCRLEIMQMPGVPVSSNNVYTQFTGLVHFAIAVADKEKVNALTETLRKDGYEIVGEPRTTGDGYYESVVLDPGIG